MYSSSSTNLTICQKIVEKKIQKAFKGKLTKNFCHAYQILAIKGFEGNLFRVMLDGVLKSCKK